jgi:hypothetical protein
VREEEEEEEERAVASPPEIGEVEERVSVPKTGGVSQSRSKTIECGTFM